MVVPSVKAIREKWPIFAGKIRIQVLGDGQLPEDLQAIVDAAGPDLWIEGEDLVDLCKQRSEEGESGCYAPGASSEPSGALASGCDSPEAMEESPVPSASPPASSVSSVVQVRRYSWRSYAKNVAYGKRREFVGTNKQTNTNSSLFPPQKPLVSRVHLTNVVRKIGQQERSKGKTVTVNKFNAHCSKGGKDMTSLSHSNRENSENMTVGNSGNGGIGSYSDKYYEINIKNNSESKGKQGKERDEALRLPGIIKGKGMMTSRIHDVIIREPPGKASLDTLVAKQCKPSQFRSRSSDSLGLRKAVQTYNKIAAIITIWFGIIMQLLEVLSCFALCKSKSTIGNSRIDSVDEGMWRWCLFAVYFLFECLSILWKYRHRIWPRLIMEGLWMGNNAINTVNKRFYQLTFRLVLARYRLRNLPHGNVCRTNDSIGIGNTGDAFVAGNVNDVCLCPYSDLWASCHIYLCRDVEILGFLHKIGSFRILIYLYIGKLRRLWLSCKQASFFLAFPIKLCTLVYFVSKDSLLDRKSHNKYQCTNLFGLALWEKAYIGILPFSSHNGSGWRELRPLVTPWTWPIKQGIEPRKCQIGFSNLMSKVSFLFSLSPPSLALALAFIVILVIYYVMYL